MTKDISLEHDYISSLLAPIPLSTTGVIEVSLAEEIESDMGFIVVDRDIDNKEERMFFHKKNANTLYVYSVNRSNPRYHEAGATVILDVLETVNYSIDTGMPQMYIYKVSDTDIFVRGGEFYIDGQSVTIPDLNTADTGGLTFGAENNIYIKDGEYFITDEEDTSSYLVGKVYVDVAGNVDDIDMVKQFPIGNGLSEEERAKLDSIKPKLYELKSNKTQTIREPLQADHNKFPTEKAVSDGLDTKVDKDGEKVLSDNNFTNAEKQIIADLAGLHLADIDFSKLHDLRNEIRDIAKASMSDGVSEKAIALEFSKYVKIEEGKVLSNNNFTDALKTALESLINDANSYINKNQIIKTVRQVTSASDLKLPTEKAVSNALKNKVDKISGKTLTDVNFSQMDKDRLDALANQKKSGLVAGPGIKVTDLGPVGWKVSADLESEKFHTGEDIQINPLNDKARFRFIDEEKYIVMTDTHRSGFYGRAKFKDATNPTIKVFYHNPSNAGKMMIDTHIRVIDRDGAITERHDSIPYNVELRKGHGVFELRPESFQGLSFDNSQAIMIKVRRVGDYYTDSNGSEFNTNLNDLDTVIGEVRAKSMYIDYDQTVTPTTQGFTGELLDSHGKAVANVVDGVVKEWIDNVTDYDTGGNNGGNNGGDNGGNTDTVAPQNSNGVSPTDNEYNLDDVSNTETENRNIDINSQTENEFTKSLIQLIKDLEESKVIQKTSTINTGNKFEVLNDIETTTLDADNTNVEQLADVLSTLIKYVSSLHPNGINTLEEIINVELTWNVTKDEELRTLDVTEATLNDYINFLGTLVEDLIAAHAFDAEDINKTNKSYLVTGATPIVQLDNSINTLKQAGGLLMNLINDLKKTKIIL